MRLDIHQLKQLDLHAKSRQFTDEDYALIQALFRSHRELINLLKDPHTSLTDLQQYLSSDESAATDRAVSDRLESRSPGRDE